MIFAAKVHLAEGQFRHLKLIFKELKFLKFQFGMSRPTVSKSVGQYFEPLKVFIKKKRTPS